jgi:glucose-6-phosphate isomerase
MALHAAFPVWLLARGGFLGGKGGVMRAGKNMADREMLRLDVGDTESVLPAGELDALQPAVLRAAQELSAGTTPGADRLGWLDLPVAMERGVLKAVQASAARARQDSEVYVVVGIGGSYLGGRAVLEALRGDRGGPQILFAGTNLCAREMSRLLRHIEDREIRLCVISKSGTTLEPALAFRFLRGRLEDRYGREGAARRITAITDVQGGRLRALAEAEGYETFAVPADVGGRFSVLTPVGLLPLAVAGVDVQELLAGAAAMRQTCSRPALRENPAHLYAAVRYGLYERGRRLEILSTNDTRLPAFQGWWRQLFGESEGKDGKGIFPATALLTTDLHSLGQYVQDGPRTLLETFLVVRRSAPGLTVPADPQGRDPDGLGYLAGRSLDEINWLAYAGTRRAHAAGGVPCLAIEVERLEAGTLGALVYFFEKAVAISGRLLGVNPFDQPGVEAYKKEIHRLLQAPATQEDPHGADQQP